MNILSTITATIGKLFHNPPKVVIVITAFVLLFLAGLIWNKSHAAVLDAPYVQMSGGTTVVRGPAPVLDLTFTQPSNALHGAFWSESLTIIGSSTYDNKPVPNNMAVRGLFLDGFGRFDVGMGLSWMLNPLPYNGSNVNFNLQVDYRFKFLPITLTYTHMSDAGMTAHNLGRDIVLIGWRFH